MAYYEVPREIYDEWLRGFGLGMNNKTARKVAVDKWNRENPDTQIAYGEVGCQLPDGFADSAEPPAIDPNDPPAAWTDGLGDRTKAMLKKLAKEHGIDVPGSCKNKNQIIEYISKKISESAEAELETREDSDGK